MWEVFPSVLTNTVMILPKLAPLQAFSWDGQGIWRTRSRSPSTAPSNMTWPHLPTDCTSQLKVVLFLRRDVFSLLPAEVPSFWWLVIARCDPGLGCIPPPLKDCCVLQNVVFNHGGAVSPFSQFCQRAELLGFRQEINTLFPSDCLEDYVN